MKRFATAAVLLLVATGGTAVNAPSASAAQFLFTFTRDTSAPENGDTDGTAQGQLTVSVKKQRICWLIDWANLESPVVATVFRGTAAKTKDKVAKLFSSSSGNVNEACIRGVSRDRLRTLVTHPASHFVRLSDDGNTGGALRAQLAGDQAAVPLMDGPSEVPPVALTGTGRAFFSFDPANDTVCWRISYEGLSGPLTDSHIHVAEVGLDGPAVVPLPIGPSPMRGCATDTDVDAVVADIDGHYANLHTGANGGGEIRGQLAP